MSLTTEDKKLLGKLVLAYRDGDKTVTNKMMEIMWPELKKRAISLAANNKLVNYTAEDLVVEAFVRGLESVHNAEEPDEFLAFTKKIMFNVMLDDTKEYSKQADKEMLTDYDSASGDEGFSDDFMETVQEEDGSWIPEENYDVKERNQILMDAINGLPEKQRAILWDFYFENMKIKEIAAERDIAENTVKATLNAARKNLYDSLNEFEKKHDVRLHGLLTVPFLSSLLEDISMPYAFGAAAQENVFARVLEQVGAAKAAASSVGAAAVKTGLGAVLKTTAAKVAAGVIAVALVGGGTYYSATHPFIFGGEPSEEQKYYDTIVEEEVDEIAIGEDIAGKLQIGNEGIWVKFTPEETGFYVFRAKLSSPLNADNIDFTVFRGKIDENKMTFTPGTISSGTNNRDYVLQVDETGTLYANSTYYIRIQYFADNGITSMYLDTATRKDIPTAPQLENKADAIEIAEGEDFAANLKKGETWFVFTPETSGIYRLEASGGSGRIAENIESLFTYKSKTTQFDIVGFGISAVTDDTKGIHYMYFADESGDQLEGGLTYYLQFDITEDNIFDSIKLVSTDETFASLT